MEVKIEKLDNFGRGITYIDETICFVENALEDEVVEIEITKEKKKYKEAISPIYQPSNPQSKVSLYGVNKDESNTKIKYDAANQSVIDISSINFLALLFNSFLRASSIMYHTNKADKVISPVNVTTLKKFHFASPILKYLSS